MEDEQFEKVEIFDTPEQLAASMQSDQETEPTSTEESQTVVEEQPLVTPDETESLQTETVQTTQESTPELPQEDAPQVTMSASKADTSEQQYSDDDLESAVLEYMSEKLGKKLSTFDDIAQATQQESVIDDRIQAIASFVQETGRSPQEWFTYQSLNTSEMDDLTAVKVDIATKHGNLTSQEIDLLVNNKYNLDPDSFSEDQVNVSRLQVKMDAATAKADIERIRSQYAAPEERSTEPAAQESLINDQWISDMSKELNNLVGLEFDLGGGKEFTFSLDDKYKSTLREKNSRLDTYFDSYVESDGSWNYDKLNSDRAIVDNIDALASSIYRQGLSDGQRGIVDNAANVSTNSPQPTAKTENPLVDQVRNIIRGNSSKTTFNY